ncbi:RNA polymerase sigma-70 factor [Carboxylicivirga sediminis]|uniref:RNA polymerase sigma-70 factor n=1 Tax=Carboxylicivirga sediminis TaxID=2006564 RepID=A0A941F3T4_9BACT|nr:RNA polymerase sigma-70 factor [Carboxylicivirga sediminis]MBR8535862.1 RNA polymerase sigma-70 factor [Carboxylicivirga sediminis]
MTEIDKIIVDSIKEGEERSFDMLFNKYYRRLHYFAFQYVRNSIEAEGLVQETFLLLWKKKNTLRCVNEAGLISWLYTVLKNMCFRYLKDQEHNQQMISELNNTHLELDLFISEEEKSDEYSFEELTTIINQTIDKLSPRCKLVMEMSRLEGFNNKEIAQELKISEKAVEGNITRGLKIIRSVVKDYLTHLFF